MLSVGRLGAGAAEYYLSDVADTTVGYYAGDGEQPGVWMGDLASEWQLAGEVTPDQLRRLLAGRHPETGAPLVGASGSNARARNRQPAASAERTRTPDRNGNRPRRPDGLAHGGIDNEDESHGIEPGAGTNPGNDETGDPGRGRSGDGHGGAVTFDTVQAAAQLEVTVRAVRYWTEAGDEIATHLRAVTPNLTLNTAGELRARHDELAAIGKLPDHLPSLFLFAHKDTGRRSGRMGWRIDNAEIGRLAELRNPPEARAGWDLVFRPPKSYSVLWAVTDPYRRDAIQAIHHEAVATALAHLEDELVVARTTHEGRQVRVEGTGLIIARFDHRDSRAGDPLLHSHCVIANVTRLDDRLVTIDPRCWYRNQQTLDAIYQATFRYLAEQRLGLVTEPVLNGWADVDGVPRTVVEHFSKRRDEIEAELARVGTRSPAAREAAALATRAPKPLPPHGISGGDDCHTRWRTEAATIGFDTAAIDGCFDRTPTRTLTEPVLDRLYDRLASADGLTATTATFTCGDVIRALATALGGTVHGADLPGLADRFCTSGRALPVDEHRPGQRKARILGRDGRFRPHRAETPWTTPEIAEIERALIDLAQPWGRTPSQPASGVVLRASTVPAGIIVATLDDRPDLSAEQRIMVRAVCASGQLFRPVVGHPGAGKTHATAACVDAFTRAGIPVVGCAVTAEAADQLSRSSGLDATPGGCDTLARLLVDLDHPEHGGLRPGTVVICDEASTVSHRDLHRLARHVQRADGALVLVGDPAQHGAVGPGHFFGWLTSQAHLDVSVLAANHRQQDILDEHGTVVVSLAAERQAGLDQREGRIVDAFRRRDAAQLVRRAPTAEAMYDQIVDDWWHDWTAGSRDPMITSLNSIRAELNQRARLRRQDAGELTGPTLVAAGREYQVGERVLARQNQRRLRDPADRAWFVKNGSRGTVVAIEPADVGGTAGAGGTGGRMLVAFEGHADQSHAVWLPGWYLDAGKLDHAYAVTDYAVQGRTLDTSKAIITDTTTRAGAYVALTRGRHQNIAYIVDGLIPDLANTGRTGVSTGAGASADVNASGAGERGDVRDGSPHQPAALRESSLDQIAAAIEAQTPEALVHEIDPHADTSARLARRCSLAELHHRLAPVLATLHAAPPDVSRRIAGLDHRVETLTTHRRLIDDRIADARSRREVPGTSPGRAVDGRRSRRDRAVSDETVTAALETERRTIDQQLVTLAARRDQLIVQDHARQMFLHRHQTEQHERDLLRSAIAKRELLVRLNANTSVQATIFNGTHPADEGSDTGGRVRRARRDALEEVALYRDRWNPSPDRPRTLGARPAGIDAAADWDRARKALRDADLEHLHDPGPSLATHEMTL